MRKIDIKIGDKYGRLTVIRETEPHKCPSGRLIRKVLCQCDCGNCTEVQLWSLRKGVTKSCGCYNKEIVQQMFSTHGMKGTRLYTIYRSMVSRCTYIKNQHYDRYGGRGIKVCDEWRNNPSAFFQWAVANGYSDELSIDRIDNDGDYAPDNCRWITQKEQVNNKSSNLYLEYNGKTKTLSQWAEFTGLRSSTIRQRLIRGWSVERALTEIPRNAKRLFGKEMFEEEGK